jgi:four helix bundle protein
MSYRDLEIWQLACEVSVRIHRMTLELLPKFEIYEEGSQIRRSSKSIRSNIVEGYGRRRYKLDYVRFLTYALASCCETTDHLETLKTGSLRDESVFNELSATLDQLGRKLNRFLQSVEAHHDPTR